MKRFLSIFLAFSMLLAMLTVPTMAEGENETVETSTAPDYSFNPVTISDSAASVTYNGKTYQVIRTAKEFFEMKGTDGEANYILAQDIDFDGVDYTSSGASKERSACYVPGVVDVDFHLEGNGFTLKNITFTNALTGGGLFATGMSEVSHKITNLTVHIADMNFNGNAVGFFYGQTYNGSNITFTSVTVNVTKHTQKQGTNTVSAFFVAKAEGPVTFNNCVIGGTVAISNTTNQGNGGFVGATTNENATLIFNDCDVTAAYSSNFSATAAYVGYPQQAVSITFNRCDASGNFTLSTTSDGAGIYIGSVYGDNSEYHFNDCDISGAFTSNGKKAAGGYIGKVNKIAEVTFTNCNATGTYTATSGTVGVFVANISHSATIKFDNCDVENTITGAASPSALYVANGASTDAKIIFDKCDFVGQFNTTGGKTGVFVGLSKATHTFIDCTVTGTVSCSESQTAGFIGYIDNGGNASFSRCTVDAKLSFASNKGGAFIGQAYTNGTVNFTNCTVSGAMVSAVDCNGAFMGVAGGAYAVDAFTEPTRVAPKITFTGCVVDALVVSAGTASAYVGSSNAGNPTITYDACENNATIYSFGSAGSWYGGNTKFYSSETENTTITVNENCTNNATVYAVTQDATDDAEFVAISEVALADGSYAYTVAQAQKAAGMTTNIVGQDLAAANSKPTIGGPAVYRFVTNKVGTLYSNAENYVYTLDCTEAPKAFKQYTTPDENDQINARVIIAVSEAKLAEIDNVTITLTFKTGEEVVNTKTFGQGGIDSYYAVYADDQIAQAAEGYVLVAVTVTGIPTAEWNNETGTVSVSMAAFDANGDAMPEYTLA